MKRQIVSLLGVVLIVGSAVMAPASMAPIDKAQAWGEDNPCTPTDRFFYGITLGHVNTDKCHPDEARELIRNQSEQLEQAQTADLNETRWTIHESSLAVSSSNNGNLDAINNTAKSIQPKARAEAQAALYEGLDAGQSKMAIKSEVNKTVEKTFETPRNNVIESWNGMAIHYDYMVNRMHQEGVYDEMAAGSGGPLGIEVSNESYNGNFEFISQIGFTLEGSYGDGARPYHHGLDNRTIQMHGNDTVLKEIHFKQYDGGRTHHVGPSTGSFNIEGEYITGIRMNHPNGYQGESNEPQFIYASFTDYQKTWNLIDSKEQQVKDNMMAVVDNVYDQYQTGEINTTQLIQNNPNVLAEEYASQYSDTGYWAYAVGTLASSGMGYPDLAKTSNMTITTNGETMTGMLLIDNSNGQTLESGVEYSPSEFDGPVIMVSQTSGDMERIHNPFTIREMYDKNGSEIYTTTYKETNFDSSNTQELQEEMDEIKQMQREIEERESVLGTGGGLEGSNIDLPPWLTQKFGGVPVWGWMIIVSLLGYVGNSVRGN